MSFWAQIRGLFNRAEPTPVTDPRPILSAAVSSYTDMSSYPDYGRGGTGSKWPAGLSSSGTAPILNHKALMRNARSAFHTSLEARAIIERLGDTIIDRGLRLTATPDADLLKISPEEAERWGSRIEAAFDLWALSRKSMLSETMNFYQAQRLAGISQQRDGEYFVRFYYSSRRDLPNPLQLGFIDPGQIRGSGSTNTFGFNTPSEDGIVRDEYGKAIAYNIRVLNPNGTYGEVTIPAVEPRSGRTFMIHGYQPEYAGQGRGYSRLSHALQELENITDFKASEVKKAISQSMLFGFVKPSAENPASNPLEALSHVGPIASRSLTTAQSVLTSGDSESLVDYIPIPEATVTVPGSMGVFNLAKGEDLRPFSNTSPVASFDGFVTSIASHLAASLSIPLEVVLMRFNQNYSASRAALVLFWRVAQIWREELVSDFLDPVYANWLAGEIASGRIQAPGWSDPRLRAAWLTSKWIGAPMPNIDPLKTARADQTYAELGAQTLDRVALDLNGSAGKANRAKLRREYEELPAAPWNKRMSGDR